MAADRANPQGAASAPPSLFALSGAQVLKTPRGPCSPTSAQEKAKDKDQNGVDDEEEEYDEVLRSLRLGTDPRMQAIKHYNEVSAGSNNEHFARMKKTHVQSEEKTRAQVHGDMAASGQKSVENVSFQELVGQELDNHMDASSRPRATGGLDDRVEWQETFDRSVKRLLVDFDLSDTPHCRLNHLDRMHDWFLQEGGKQQRKAAQAPSFVTVDRSGTVPLPEGSTHNITGKLSSASLILAGSVSMRRSRNVPDVPGMPSYITGPRSAR